jgi:hypothetical protein
MLPNPDKLDRWLKSGIIKSHILSGVHCYGGIIIKSANSGPLTLELGPRGLSKFEWMRSLRGCLHGMQWLMSHGLPNLTLFQVGGKQNHETVTSQTLTIFDLLKMGVGGSTE